MLTDHAESSWPYMLLALEDILEYLNEPDPTPIYPGSEVHYQITHIVAMAKDADNTLTKP